MCHGADCGEGPVLAILALRTLCVAAGGSAPLLPPHPLRAAASHCQVGQESRREIEPESWILRPHAVPTVPAAPLSSASPLAVAFCCIAKLVRSRRAKMSLARPSYPDGILVVPVGT